MMCARGRRVCDTHARLNVVLNHLSSHILSYSASCGASTHRIVMWTNLLEITAQRARAMERSVQGMAPLALAGVHT